MKQILILESILLGLASAVLVFCGILSGSKTGEWKVQEQAVKRGHAEWVVDCAGKTQFKWKEAKP